MDLTLNPETIAALREMDEPGSNAFLQEIVSAYLLDSKLRIEAVRACQASGDTVGLSKAAHAIKGSSLNIGAEKLGSLMHTIEKDAKTGQLAQPETLKEAGLELERVFEALQACLQ